MGEYAAYVWSSYGCTLLALVWLGVSARQQWRRELKQAQRRVQVALQNELKEQGT